MKTELDNLEIKINADASRANDALGRLVKKLGDLSGALGSVTASNKFTNLANGVTQFANSMRTVSSVGTADFTRLAKGITKLSTIDSKTISNAAESVNKFGKSLGVLTSVSSGAKQIAELASNIAKFGYKSSTQAIKNIPALSTAMRQLMAELSKVPKVSQNLIDMTNALAKLARTGASSGRAASSQISVFEKLGNVIQRTKSHSFSLASALGKLYATYWVFIRGMGKVKDAIDISSSLTEVENVVRTTFGDYEKMIQDFSKTSIENYGMSELTAKQVASRFQAMGTALGFAQGKMANMSVELTKLTADMASFYNEEQSDVARRLQAIFTGETEPLRRYGLDLTQATLKEWALKKGIDADISSMSQAQKTMLRYLYVMENTAAAQGDFARTADKRNISFMCRAA